MKIVYTPDRSWREAPPEKPEFGDVLSLSSNNWDDYGYKTTLNARIYVNNQSVPFDFSIKLLMENIDNTAVKLDELCKNGWDGVFPIPNANYIALPSDIDFYKVLISKIGEDATITLLNELRDAGFTFNVNHDRNSEALIEQEAFNTSLLRGSGSSKAFQDGYLIFNDILSEIRDFQLNIIARDEHVLTIPFKFKSSLLPYDINVIIGPNGVGKSHCLKSLVEYWLQTGIGDLSVLKNKKHVPFDERPNISKLVLVSYSPFEDFNLDMEDNNLQDKQTYQYFGFRQKREDGTIGISRNLPALNSSNSLIDMVCDDEKYQFIDGRLNKFETINDVLKSAIDYEKCALKLKGSEQQAFFSQQTITINGEWFFLGEHISSWVGNIDSLRDACNLNDGVIFLKNNQIVPLSSGQRLFAYIVINVAASIRDNSLIVIDEPELFLHPTLEIEFVGLLKKILKPFRSKAILATHSLSITREVPSKCVHIFRHKDDELEIVPPPFETFGGNVQRISSYVFGDKSISKPFDEWLEMQLQDIKDPEKLIEMLNEEINEEMIMKIISLGRKHHGR
ncbi:AAA family ATPase [Pectobacterium carotovorum]|uniref:AAA family ATPase n=1 Tax=Pectobacterium carotovorum TaxID=554 RepID=UPI0015DDAF39|nr:AAA family ATPase [Pectobacterium carotovorum]MBA0191643.1 AAA family ATPase [Pectobacterium carotovorum]MBA0199068.1 AAA family ATPase [Pectobacterium carotovorum]